MHLDRNDLRGILKFAAIMSFAVSFLFVAMNLGDSEGMKKDRGTGRVYWSAAQNLDASTMSYAAVPLVLGAVFTTLVAIRSLWR